MAKKKTAGSSAPSTRAASEAAPRTRSAPRKGAVTAPTDRSPIGEGSATSSEEIQLAAGNGNASRASQPSYEEVAQAAYERYLQRGGIDGQDFDDWVSAERELRERYTR